MLNTNCKHLQYAFPDVISNLLIFAYTRKFFICFNCSAGAVLSPLGESMIE